MNRRQLLVVSIAILAALGSALALSTASTDTTTSAQVESATTPVLASPPGDPSAPAPDAVATSCGTQPPPVPCNRWVCTIDGWNEVPLANGTACSDGNASTCGDTCLNGFCIAGTTICGPCETCSGTTCAKLAAGTTCPVASNPPNPCEAVCDGVSPYCQPR